ncbi:tape measure protein [Streptomyces phage LazerLemon]|nr:tape measure protein [Streptomyces phage LazerLemon]
MAGNTFDAGSIESRLVLDRSDFVEGLREARAEGENFARQKFTATVDVDARGVIGTIASIRTELASLRNVNLNVGVTGSNAQIRAISQSATALNGRNITMGISVSGIGDVAAQLRTIRQNVNALDGRTININADFDNAAAMAQIRAMRAELNALNGTTANTNAGFNRMGGMSGFLRKHMLDLVAAAMLAAPAIFPLTNAALGAAAAFTTMGVAVAGAVGIFGLATFGAVQSVGRLNKELDKAKKNLEQQKERLGQLTPGTDAYAQQLKKVEEAQQRVNDAQKAFSPAQKEAADAMSGVTLSWQQFIQATQNTTLPIVTQFLRMVSDALPKLVPAVKAVAPEFKAIADNLRGWVNDGGLDRFVQFIITTGVPAFRNLRLAGANLATVMGNMFRAFSGQARGMSRSILDVTAAMARWSNEGGFERFIARVNANAPQVRQFFTALWDALKNIHAALAPLGPLGLGFVTILLQIVAALPPEWIRAVYLGFIAWRGIMLIVTIFNLLRTAILAVRTAVFMLSLAFSISPFGWILIAVGAIVAIIVVVGLKMGWLQKAWKAAWDGIKVAAVWVWENALKPAWNGIKTGLDAIGKAAMWLWTNAIRPAFNFISVAARLLVVVLGTVLFTPLYLAFKLLRTVVMWLWTNAFKPVFGWIVAGAKLWWAAVKVYFNFLVSIIKTLATWAKWLWTNAFKPVFGWIVQGAKLWWAAVKIYFRYMWEGLQTVGKWGKWLWTNALKPAFGWIADGARVLYNRGVKPPVNLIIGIFKTLGSWAKWLWEKAIRPFWDRIKDGTTVLKDKMVGIFDKMKDGIGKVWNAIKKIAAVPINFVIDTVYNGGIVKVWNKIAGAVGLDKMKLGTVPKIKYDRGGRVNGGYGLSGQDSVAIQANPNEHIWTADEVRNFGGHGAMAAFRASFSGNGKARVAPGAGTTDYARGSGQKFFLGGGIIDWTKDTLGDAAGGLKNAWDATGGRVVSAAWDKLKDVTRGAIGTIANPILKSIRSGVAKGVGGVIPGKPAWEDLAIGTATKPINMILDWIAKDDATHSVGGANVGKALDWAKSQEGKPYIWGGVGPKGYDCSGFMSAIQNVIDGKSPYTRRWATGAFPPGAKGWKRDLKAPFTVGITNAGVGHTAGTLAGVNVESRGGRGVVVGKGARGTKDGMFSSEWGYTPSMGGGGGAGRWAETVTAVLRELNKYSPGNLANVLKAITKESGGNPNAVNNWDSNARMGQASRGLLQVIPSTFAAYAGKYKSKGITDPYANIYAAVRYASARYGSGWSARMARPGGYKLGGVTMPGLHMVGEAGPELIATSGNDRVFTASETQQMLRRAGSGAGVTVIKLPDTFVVKIGEHEFRAMLDDETRAVLADMIREAEGAR